jgi:hypothetical protein
MLSRSQSQFWEIRLAAMRACGTASQKQISLAIHEQVVMAAGILGSNSQSNAGLPLLSISAGNSVPMTVPPAQKPGARVPGRDGVLPVNTIATASQGTRQGSHEQTGSVSSTVLNLSSFGCQGC